jgi:hypothetical protein
MLVVEIEELVVGNVKETVLVTEEEIEIVQTNQRREANKL